MIDPFNVSFKSGKNHNEKNIHMRNKYKSQKQNTTDAQTECKILILS